MAFFAHFDASGILVQTGSCPDSMLGLQLPPAGGGQVELSEAPTDPQAFLQGNCVVAGSVVGKTYMSIGVSDISISAGASVTLTGVPAGSTVSINGGTPTAVNGGSLVAPSVVAGSLTVVLACPPIYFSWSTTITVT